MYDAMDAVSRGAVPEISRGLSTRCDEDHATPKAVPLRRAAFRISSLLVLVLRNTSASATPPNLAYSADRMAISCLVTEGDCLASEQDLKFLCRSARPVSVNNGTRGSFR
jgi:hypothetical protein